MELRDTSLSIMARDIFVAVVSVTNEEWDSLMARWYKFKHDIKMFWINLKESMK